MSSINNKIRLLAFSITLVGAGSFSSTEPKILQDIGPFVVLLGCILACVCAWMKDS